MKLILFFIFAFISQPAFAKTKPPAYSPGVPKPTHSEVRYGKHERNVLDFWKAESKSPAPVAFVIHGGGWKGGSKERLDRFADPDALLQKGISIVAINYRYVTSDESPPVKAPLHDAARALQFVRSQAKNGTSIKNELVLQGDPPVPAPAFGLPSMMTLLIQKTKIPSFVNRVVYNAPQLWVPRPPSIPNK